MVWAALRPDTVFQLVSARRSGGVTLRTASSNHDYSGRHCEKGICYTGVVDMKRYDGSTGEKGADSECFQKRKRRIVGLCVLDNGLLS